jgi:hypothetical protein
MDNDHIILGDTMIIGACLWSDFDNGNPTIMNFCQNRMNDYNLIKKPSVSEMYTSWSRSTIRPQDVLDKFKISKNYIIEMLEKANELGIKNKIVVTHHAPSFQSVDTRYRDDSLNPAYCSSLEEIALTYNVNLWTHGHQHCSNDYMIGDTRVICNAFGYHAYDTNDDFKHDLVIEL